MDNSDKVLTRFTESFSCSQKTLVAATQEELQESFSKAPGRLKEAISSEKEGGPKGYWVPISFYNKKNLNKRIYNRALWDNVINKQRGTYVGSPMLADHPQGDNDGNPKDICGVWLDGKIGEPDENGIGMVYGLLVPSGTLGRDLMDHLKNGLRIGTSSSGFGRLLPDGVTVDPDTYIIERLGDCVLAPSQSTYFSYDEGSNDMVDTSVRESVERKQESASSTTIDTVSDRNTNITNNTENFMEKAVSDHKFTKLEEKRFRRDMLSFLENAEKNIKDPQERLEEFKTIESYLEDGACPDLKEQIEQKIKAEEDFIKTAIAEKIQMKEELQIESTKDLKRKLTQIMEDTSVLNKEAKDWKKVSEALQEKLIKASTALKKAEAELKVRPTSKYAQTLEESCSVLKAEKEATEKSQVEICSKYMEKSLASESRAVAAEHKVAELQEEVDYLKGGTVASIKGIKALQEKIALLSKENEELKESVDKLAKDNALYAESLQDQRAKMEELVEKQNKSNSIIRSYRESNSELKKALDASVSKTKKMTESADKAAARKAMSPQERFYAEKEAQYGDSVKELKEKICGAKTLPDAKNAFLFGMLSEQKDDDLEAIKAGSDMARFTESLDNRSESMAKVLKSRQGWI